MLKRMIFIVCAVTSFSSLAKAEKFQLKSPTIAAGSTISMMHVFNSFGCTGKNISPALEWSGAPKGTKSFAISIYDPDAPTGSGWWHWVVFNIPANVTKLPANAGSPEAKLMPAGAVQSRTDFGKTGYGGPCPPAGDKPHHYNIRVFALKETLPLDAEASGAMVGFYIHSNVLAEAKLTATFGR